MSKPQIPVIHVNHGVANRFSDAIEINKHLLKYPKLYYPILRHEQGHSDKVFSGHDFKHDINSHHGVDQMQLIKFMFKHPKSFTQLLPFYYTKKRKIVIDINLSIMYGIMLGIVSLVYWFIF